VAILATVGVFGIMEFFTVHAGTFQSNDIGTDATERSHRATRIKMGETFYPSIRRLAVVRPFGVSSAASLPQTFSDWADFLPCNVVDRIGENNVEVDIFLSFSQTYEASPNALSSINTVIDKFNAESTENEISWSKCFRNIFAIEANILADDDLYLPNQARRKMMWVNGPNRQFSAAVRSITGGDFGKYDAMFLMEGDCMPMKKYWLDSLLEEAEGSFLEHGPFAILGSSDPFVVVKFNRRIIHQTCYIPKNPKIGAQNFRKHNKLPCRCRFHRDCQG